MSPFVLDSVTSADGTTIGFRSYGAGPAVVLLHGGMNSANDLADLAAALAADFSVHVPDRRGRGTSGPFGPDDTVAEQVADVRALLERTGAERVFGLSAGGVVALAAAAQLPGITHLAVYEPPLAAGADWAWLGRYDDELAAGRLGAALVTAAKGTGDTSLLTRLPRPVTEPFFTFVMKAQAKAVRPGEVSLQELVRTMHHDAAMVRAMAGRLDAFAGIGARVLMMRGSRSPRELREPVAALAGLIAGATLVELAGADHLAATNGKRPAAVAAQLRAFFR